MRSRRTENCTRLEDALPGLICNSVRVRTRLGLMPGENWTVDAYFDGAPEDFARHGLIEHVDELLSLPRSGRRGRFRRLANGLYRVNYWRNDNPHQGEYKGREFARAHGLVPDEAPAANRAPGVRRVGNVIYAAARFLGAELNPDCVA
jgi:hypothetical protein